MADELTLTFGSSLVSGNLKHSKSTHTLKVTVLGTRYIENVQSVGTADEAIVVGDLASAGYMECKNLDPSNYIQIGLAASYTIRLKALQEAQFPLDTLSIFAKANTGACLLQYTIYEA